MLKLHLKMTKDTLISLNTPPIHFLFQVGYFVGGVASLESSEIAGIAVTFTAIALVLLVLALVFLVRQRGKCVNSRHPTSSDASANGVKSATVTANGHLALQEKTPSTNGHAMHQNVS